MTEESNVNDNEEELKCAIRIENINRISFYEDEITSVIYNPDTKETMISHQYDCNRKYYIHDADQKIYIALMEYEGKFQRFPSIKLSGHIRVHELDYIITDPTCELTINPEEQ